MTATADALPESKPNLQGQCASCNRGIPYGYIPIVTKWKAKVWSETSNQKLTVMVPEEMYCRQCFGNVEQQKSRRLRHQPPSFITAPAEELSAKAIAIRLLSVLSSTPHGSKKLAELAELEYSDLILDILKRLKVAGKVQLIEGRWARA